MKSRNPLWGEYWGSVFSVKRVTRSSRQFYQSLGGWVGHLTTLILKTALDALQWLANYQGRASTVLQARQKPVISDL